MVAAKKINKNAAFELWRRGNLSWKLDATQMELYELYYSGKFKSNTWLCARRTGKSYCLAILALEQCIRVKNSIVKYAAPTKLQINTILRPIFKKILEDCPEDVKPVFNRSEFTYYFPNGSEIQLAGTDGGHADKLRGGDSHIAIVDEAGSCMNLKELIQEILFPTTIMTKGKILLVGTPPKKSDHDFLWFIKEAKMKGSLIKKTIFDNKRLTPEEIQETIEESGGMESDATKRELLCEIIRDSQLTIVPEFTEELQKEIVKEWKKPPFYHCYEAMDIGGVDLTGVLFAYYDFRNDKIVIEDDIIIDFQEEGKNIKVLTDEIDKKEQLHWTDPITNEMVRPDRVSDISPITINEIRYHSKGKINFRNTKKDDKDTAINNFRTLLKMGKIIINPRCVNLIRHLDDGEWANANKKDFARSPDNGHYDLIDAAIYLVRNIDFRKNPYPRDYDFNLKDINNQVTLINSNNKQKRGDQLDLKSICSRIFNKKS